MEEAIKQLAEAIGSLKSQPSSASWTIWIAPGVTLILGLITIFVQLYNTYSQKKQFQAQLGEQKEQFNKQLEQQKELNRKQLQAQVLAKARIEQLQEMRKVFAQFIESNSRCYEALLAIKFGLKTNQKMLEELIKEYELEPKTSSSWVSWRLLESYFPDSENQNDVKMREVIGILPYYLDGYKKSLLKLARGEIYDLDVEIEKNTPEQIKKQLKDWKLDAGDSSHYFDTSVAIISDNISNYLNKEWQKAQSEVIGR